MKIINLDIFATHFLFIKEFLLNLCINEKTRCFHIWLTFIRNLNVNISVLNPTLNLSH